MAGQRRQRQRRLLFGVGIGLTIDEFALWVRLDDVYWAREGRSSIDAAVIAVGALGILVLGARPFEIGSGAESELLIGVLAVAILIAVVGVCLAKRRVVHGLVGIYVFPLAGYTAVRLGKPGSPWARRFCGEREPRQAGEGGATLRRGAADRSLQGEFPGRSGRGDGEYEAKLAERDAKAAEEAATLEAADEIRRRAESQRTTPERR